MADRLAEVARSDPAMALTEEEIKALTPRRYFQLVLQHAARTFNIVLGIDVASKSAAYEHPRAGDNPLTEEEIKRLVHQYARAEVVARGLDVPTAGNGTPGRLRAN